MKQSEKVMNKLLSKYEIELNIFYILLEDDYPLIGKAIRDIMQKIDDIYQKLVKLYNKEIISCREKIHYYRTETKKMPIYNSKDNVEHIKKLIEIEGKNQHLYYNKFKALMKIYISLKKCLDAYINIVMIGGDDYEH